MVFPLIPLIIGGSLIGGGGWLAGRSGGGGAVELFTSKKSNQTTNQNQTSNLDIFAPTITRTSDIQYNIASGGSNITTKKDQAVSVSPDVSPNFNPSQMATPITTQGGGTQQAGEDGLDFRGMALAGGVGLIGFYMWNNRKGAKK